MQSRSSALHIKDLVQVSSGGSSESPVVETELNVEFAGDVIDVESDSASLIPVDFSDDVEQLEIGEIRDTQGRLSDALESIEHVTGVSVIPLEMTSISDEVMSLQRHEIFVWNKKRYAMSSEIRADFVREYELRILSQLSAGLPFSESLITSVDYNGYTYQTLKLSRVEWTYIMSRFRKYKQRLYYTSSNEIFLEILGEHAN